MKKSVFAIAFASLAVLLISGCASSGVQYSSNETASEKKARIAAEKLLEKQKKDPYTGWVYLPEKNPDIVSGDVKLVLKTGTGSFGIYVIPEQGKEIPLLSTYDAYNSSFFAIKCGRKEYRLNRENGVRTSTRKTAYGAQLVYTIDNKAQVTVDFSLFPSISTSSRVDMIRVTVYTTNLGKTIQSFSVKGVFDTILGENAYTHFSTAARSRVDGERLYTDMSGERWIRSSNENSTIQFLLYGKGITKPQAVILGSKDLLSGTSWQPAIQESRGFSSVLTYNNSALGINWPTFYLDPQKTNAITFYISVAADGNEPAGKEFLTALESGNIALSATPPSYVTTSDVAATPSLIPQEELTTFYRTGMPVIDDGKDHSLDGTAENQEPDKTSISLEDEPAPVPSIDTPSIDTIEDVVSVAAPEKINEPEVIETVKEPSVSETSVTETVVPETSVTDNQLDPEYIQNLLDRIAELEENPSTAAAEELQSLSEELDSILLKLRSLR